MLEARSTYHAKDYGVHLGHSRRRDAGAARADEDRRGGFELGGWATPFNDPESGAAMARAGASSALLFGRRTYEDFYGFWPSCVDNPFAAILNSTTKYVVSGTLSEPLSWQNSVLVSGGGSDAVRRLKSQTGPDLVILGSGELLRSLTAARLIDQQILLIHPLVLGSGAKFFQAGSETSLRLVDSKATATGVIVDTYEAARETVSA